MSLALTIDRADTNERRATLSPRSSRWATPRSSGERGAPITVTPLRSRRGATALRRAGCRGSPPPSPPVTPRRGRGGFSTDLLGHGRRGGVPNTSPAMTVRSTSCVAASDVLPEHVPMLIGAITTPDATADMPIGRVQDFTASIVETGCDRFGSAGRDEARTYPEVRRRPLASPMWVRTWWNRQSRAPFSTEVAHRLPNGRCDGCRPTWRVAHSHARCRCDPGRRLPAVAPGSTPWSSDRRPKPPSWGRARAW